MKDKVIQSGINAYKTLSRHVALPVLQCKVETTKVCNLKCVGCRRNFEETLAKMPGPRHLTVGMLWQICATTNMQFVRFEGDGEPTCNPHFRGLMRWCHKMGIRSAMTCNGTLLDKEYIKFLEDNGMVRIHISFDGATKETFERQRPPAKYEQVLGVCREIGKSKIQLFMNIVPSTEELIDEMLDYVDFCKEVGATGILPIKFQADRGFGTPMDWDKHQGLLEEFKAKTKEKGMILVSTATTEPTFHECEDAYVCPYITLDGSVYACAYMANMRTSEVYLDKVISVPYRNYVMGNINETWLSKLWRNEAYRELRQELQDTRKLFSGKVISRTILLKGKKIMEAKTKVRFGYCHFCLCRWGETGL